MARIISALFSGEQTELGEVPATDFAKLIIGLQQALAATAGTVIARRRRGGTGRHPGAIEAASRLRVVDIKPGSTNALFALADTDDAEQALNMSVPHLAELSFERLVQMLSGPGDVDRDVASVISRLADDLSIGRRGGDRILSLGFRDEEPRARLDASTATRMRRIAEAVSEEHDDLLVGELYEADFDANTARLQPPIGGPVVIKFDDSQADEIYRVLRGSAQLRGMVMYDRTSLEAKRIDLQEIETPPLQTAIEGTVEDSFWSHKTVAELAEEQGIDGPQDIRTLQAATPLTREEIDAFFAAAEG